jgi:hypothetical protein
VVSTKLHVQTALPEPKVFVGAATKYGGSPSGGRGEGARSAGGARSAELRAKTEGNQEIQLETEELNTNSLSHTFYKLCSQN